MRYNKVTLRDLDLSNKKVVVRLDLNVPIKDGVIKNKTRILGAVETLQYLLDKGCKVVVLSHFDRIKSWEEIELGKKSLELVAREFQNIFSSKKVQFVSECHFDEVKKIVSSSDSDIFVLENTRYYDIDCQTKEVIKMESGNHPALAEFYASLGDVFVNDAFGTSHRAHASNVGVAEASKESAVGFLIEKELKALDYACESPEGPKVMILGGAKASDKLKLIKEIISNVDKLIIGGGMTYTFLKAQGKEVGSSLVEKDYIDQCGEILKQYQDKIVLPVDHKIASEFKDIEGKIIEEFDVEHSTWMALDVGPKSIELFSRILETAKIITWNGPLGVFEFENFNKGTFAILDKLVELTKKGTYTLVGGGDSVAAAEKKGVTDQLSFVSTGGGATLTFLEGGKMPGIEVIKDKAS